MPIAPANSATVSHSGHLLEMSPSSGAAAGRAMTPLARSSSSSTSSAASRMRAASSSASSQFARANGSGCRRLMRSRISCSRGSRVEAPSRCASIVRQDVANERVVRRRHSEPRRLRVMRAWSQGHGRSVDRRNYGPRGISREIPQTPRRRRIDTMRKATSGTAPARAVPESCAVYDPGT